MADEPIFSVYHSFDEAPLDAAPLDEGDDSLHAHDLGRGGAVLLAPTRSTLAPEETHRNLVVPHPRDLKRGMAGKDVLALQRALSHAGFHSWKLRTGQFGAQLEKDLKAFQKAKGLTVDGVYGPKTHAKLAAVPGAYTAFEIDLILQTVETPMHKMQRIFLASAMQLYNMRSRVHYTQGWSRMWIVKHHITTVAELSRQLQVYEDCSSSMTGLYYIAGAPDPNGFRYNGLGYTGTLGVCGQRWTSAFRPPIGALPLYGSSFPWKHVTGVVSSPEAASVRVLSHGTEAGPLLLGIDYRGDRAQIRVYPGIHY